MTPTARADTRSWRPAPLVLASGGVHAAALAAVAAAPDTWPYALGAVAVNHVAIAAASMSPRGRLLGPNLTRLPGAEPGVVALTFDDGPDPEVTPRVLALLAQAGAVATFFCIGRRAAQHPDVVAAIRAAGHGIENHTFSHQRTFALQSAAAMRDEIQRAQAVLASQAGEPPRYFRAPAGMRNPWLAPVLAAEGLSLVSWTRRGFDAVTGDPRVVAARLVKGLAAGDILVLHDGGCARTRRGAPVVPDALARVLDRMAAQDLRSVALPRPAPGPPAGR